jgi:hypothetical protein
MWARMRSPGEIAKASGSALRLIIDQVLAVDGDEPTGARHAIELAREKSVMGQELAVISRIAHVGDRVIVDIEAGKRRRKYRETDAVVRQLPHHITAIAPECGEFFAVGVA